MRRSWSCRDPRKCHPCGAARGSGPTQSAGAHRVEGGRESAGISDTSAGSGVGGSGPSPDPVDLGDVRLARAGGIEGRPRLRRHLWRMCMALFIASLSFFIGQADEIPAAIRIPALLAVPVVAVPLTVLSWLCRLRRRGADRAVHLRVGLRPGRRHRSLRSSARAATGDLRAQRRGVGTRPSLRLTVLRGEPRRRCVPGRRGDGAAMTGRVGRVEPRV